MKNTWACCVLLLAAWTVEAEEQEVVTYEVSEDGNSWWVRIEDRINPPKPTKVHRRDCYDFIWDMRWEELPIQVVVNPTNSQGIPEEVILDVVRSSLATWNDAIGIEFFVPEPEVDHTVDFASNYRPNSIVFSDYGNSGVLAFAGISGGCIDGMSCQILGFNIGVNMHYPWGDAEEEPNVYDLEAVLTHELGHALGLADRYQNECSEVTMYGYSIPGDVRHRSLEWADRKGLRVFYRGFKEKPVDP